MLKYDYEIERDEGNEIKVYKPNQMIGTSLPSIVYIEGPNSSGKSTLLHVIALGFWGLSNEKIPASLKSKMHDILKSGHQKVKFQIEVYDKDGTLCLISEKNGLASAEPEVYEVKDSNKVRLAPEAFFRRYNLIYDIPEKPTERLRELTGQIKSFQRLYTVKIGAFEEHLRQIIKQIRDAADPEKEKELSDNQDELTTDIKNFEFDKKDLILKLEPLRKSVYCNFFHQHQVRLLSLEREIEELETKKKNLEKFITTRKKEDSAFTGVVKLKFLELHTCFGEVMKLLKLVLPNEESFHLKKWERINIFEVCAEANFPPDFKTDITRFKTILNRRLQETDKDDSLKEVELVQELIGVLENYKFVKFKIPGIEKSIPEFIGDLQSQLEKRSTIIKVSENINKCMEEIDKLERTATEIGERLFPKLRELKQSKSEKTKENRGITEIDQKLQVKRQEYNKIKNNFDFYEEKYEEVGKPKKNDICEIGKGSLVDYKEWSEEQLLEEIEEMENKIKKFDSDIKSTNEKIAKINYQLNILKSRKPHKYQNKLNELNNLLQKTMFLRERIGKKYSSFVSEIMEEKILEGTSLSDEQLKYNKAISRYLAKVILKLRHSGNEYKIQDIDLIKRVITTIEGKVIHFSDMGTGQSQSAYLTGLLRASDGRKIIALFDEVAHMDNKSLEPIYNRFKELYDQGELLAGIVVQKAEEIKVISKI